MKNKQTNKKCSIDPYPFEHYLQFFFFFFRPWQPGEKKKGLISISYIISYNGYQWLQIQYLVKLSAILRITKYCLIQYLKSITEIYQIKIEEFMGRKK